MSPQINLVNPELLPTQPQFTLNSLVQGLGIVLLGLSLLSGFAHYQLRGLEREVGVSNGRVRAAQAGVDQLASLIGQRRPNETLSQRLADAQRERTALAQVSELLRNGGEPGSTRGYSAQLDGLAQSTVQGVWLTGLRVHGEQLGLEGMALDSQRVPAYLAALKRVDGLRGKDFAVFEMNRTAESDTAPPGHPDAVRFKLDASRKEGPRS